VCRTRKDFLVLSVLAKLPGVTVSAGVCRDILSTARRFARSDDEARDLMQDVLAIALERGVDDWSTPERQAWLRGVVRRRAAFVGRSEARRRRRELLAGHEDAERAGAWAWQPEFLRSLPHSLRLVALLTSADLCAAEIRWLLRLNDTALRQRLSALRRALRGHDEPPTLPAAEPPASFGPQRVQVLSLLRRRGGRAIATHDPDGHVLFLKIDAHNRAGAGNR
jgi:RNA polymerase sigma-70 factor (ECF subfamily)